MTVQSMTGFARTAGQDDRFAWVWEGRSVNAKGLDVRCRIPGGYEATEQAVKVSAKKLFARGNVTLGLSLERLDQGAATYRVNRDLLAKVRELRDELAGEIAADAPTIEGLLSIRGMLEMVDDADTEEALAARVEALTASGEEMLDALAAARGAEGAQLDTVLSSQLAMLADLVTKAASSTAAQPEALRARLQSIVAELLGTDLGLSEERLAQEAALLVGKADIREEIDRLEVHIASARELLTAAGAVGRRLDFLCQELNREANTLCSKSADVELTQIGLEMKVTIEQFREQVQNVE